MKDPDPGLPVKEFNQFIDRQLRGEPNDLEQWLNMSEQQKLVVNEIKKAIKRCTVDKELHPVQ